MKAFGLNLKQNTPDLTLSPDPARYPDASGFCTKSLVIRATDSWNYTLGKSRLGAHEKIHNGQPVVRNEKRIAPSINKRVGLCPAAIELLRV